MRSWLAAINALCVVLPAAAFAAPPVVTTVPADPNNALSLHDVISGRPTTLKGAVDSACANVCTWDWDPGDGSATVSGNVDADPIDPTQLDDVGYNPYWAVWAEHTYTGNPGDVFIATLRVTNPDGTTSGTYRVQVRANALSSEVNAAIDEALWHMHRNQFRFLGTPDLGQPFGGTVLMGRWDYPQVFGSATASVTGASVNAFEANGYLETGPSSSPYSETVALGLKYLFTRLATQAMDLQTVGAVGRSDDPDTNGDGIGIAPNEQDPPYQSGMIMDAIVAAGTPATVTTTGPAGVVGLSYGKIIQDMADWYAWAQSDSTVHGGWSYGAWDNNPGAHDNSASGWAAIGLVAARDVTGATVPDFVGALNETGLELTDNESDTLDIDGAHGYTNSPGAIWGAFGVTGAALVQMDMDEIQSTTAAAPDERWVRAENYFRRHFNDPAVGDNFKNYYYGMFNFAKAMRQAKPAPVIDIGTQVGAAEGGVGCGPSSNDTNGDGVPDVPDCGANGPEVIDWYNDPVNGIARTIIDYQILPGDPDTQGECGNVQPGPCPNIGGFTDRPGNSQGSNQDDHSQPWATQILTRSLFQAGPVANAAAAPNPTAENVAVTFDPSGSFHQDPAHQIVLYEWDFDNDGDFDTSTDDPTTVDHAFVCDPPGALPCSFPVTLRVTDDNDPALTAEAVVVVDVTVPPHPPTAVSGGPYQVCVGLPATLDGSGSFDIDEGDHEVGAPPDTITAYEWDLDLSSGAPFDTIDSTDIQPTLPAFNTVGSFDIALRVTDNTELSFPTSGQPNLTNVDSTTLEVVECPDIDLSLSASVDPTTTPLDTVATMTFTVSNGGPDPTTGADLVLTVPADLLIGSATPTAGTCSIFPDSVSCDLGVIDAGDSVDVVMPVRSSVAGSYTVDGTVAPANLDNDTDLTNNDAAATLIVLSAGEATSDLALTGSVDPPIFDPDATSNVTLTVSNNGPDGSSGAALSIDLPNSALKALSATVEDGSCTIDPDVTCTLGPVAGGGSTDVHLVIAAVRNGDPTISAHVDPVGTDVDPDLSNNDASVSVTVRLEVVVRGKGGEGGVGLLELLVLALAAPFVMWRRRMRLASAAALVLAFAIGAAAPPRALAEGGGFYVGASAGQSSAGLSSDDYRNDLQSVGINARNVSLDDSDTAWKAFAGYSFNEYFAVEAGYTNLGQMESEYTTTIDPGGEQELLRNTANVHPYFAAGATLAIVGSVPIGEQFDLFAKLGGFWWDSSDVVVEIVQGSRGALALGKDGTDIFYGTGVGLALGNGWKVKGEYERYEVDNQDCDFFSFGVEKHFGGNP